VSDLIKAMGWSASDTAVKLGFSSAKVSRLLTLLTLPETIQEEIRDGRIPASSGAELSRIEDPARQAAVAGEIVAGRMTRDGVSGAAKAARNSSCQTDSSTVSRATAVLGDGWSVSVLGQSLTLERVIGIIENLLSRARRARTQGLTLPTFLKVLRETKA
jgi:ParB family transcriptional regulator, chromosome partitioning protein